MKEFYRKQIRKKRLIREKKTVKLMIMIYCQKNHSDGNHLCPKCEELNRYSAKRVDCCKFGDQKPACNKCTLHCYNSEMQNRIKEVMRYSGPRMIWQHPVLAVFHLLNLRR